MNPLRHVFSAAAVATLATAGCPYVAGETAVADVQPAKMADEACCATEAAPATAVAVQIEE